MRSINTHLKALYTQKMLFGALPTQTSATPSQSKNHEGANPKRQRAPGETATSAPAVDEDKLALHNAIQGQVVTRFPPEASGFLHIGHAKAVLIGRMVADKYQGKLLFRFDDTNPDKEKHEFEDAILQDLKNLGVTWDIGPTYSSDYMDLYVSKAEQLITEGLAYCDTTPREELQKHRFDGTATSCRDNSVEKNMFLWREMLQGTELGSTACLRAKISVTETNKALRDPVLFRVNVNPHARQGTKYKCYPTYDFCCPIIDSVEGVTHALRTNEYHDRNAQYYWILDALRMRKPILEDFSRLNMEYCVMSKRKLTQLVASGKVEGWDDPRVPTVRGLLRRGLTVAALREFVKVQGMSKAVNVMEWSKLWNLNTQIIDPIAPRVTAVSTELKTRGSVINFPAEGIATEPRPFHKKNPELGTKPHTKAASIFLDSEDVALLQEGEEVTLMDWGNAFIRSIATDPNTKLPTTCTVELNPTGDVKRTKYKLTWVPDVAAVVRAVALEYDYLLTKAKPEPDDDILAIVAPCSKYTQDLICEPAAALLQKGQHFQIERRGFYVVHEVSPTLLTFIAIPDGREKVNHLSAKYQYRKQNVVAAPAPSLETKRTAKAKSKAQPQ